MTMIVAGGAGFIGSNFIFFIMNTYPDCRVVCLDKLTYAGSLATLRPLLNNPRFRFVKADICDPVAVNRVFEEESPDCVINFAAESHVDRSITNPAVFLNTNILGTQVLMDACVRYGTSRYHQISTDEVYGDLPLDASGVAFSEHSPIRPSSPYSASKAGADLLVQAYHRTYGLPVTISRCVNNYGPYQFPEKLIPLMVLRALHDQPMPVYGNGKNIREWLYVEDHCKAVDMIVRHGKIGEIYNIGSGVELPNIHIVHAIRESLQKPENLIHYVADRKGHDLRYAVDASKIRNELGWAPETTFSQSLHRTIQWYLEHPQWWKRILDGTYLNDSEENLL